MRDRFPVPWNAKIEQPGPDRYCAERLVYPLGRGRYITRYELRIQWEAHFTPDEGREQKAQVPRHAWYRLGKRILYLQRQASDIEVLGRRTPYGLTRPLQVAVRARAPPSSLRLGANHAQLLHTQHRRSTTAGQVSSLRSFLLSRRESPRARGARSILRPPPLRSSGTKSLMKSRRARPPCRPA